MYAAVQAPMTMKNPLTMLPIESWGTPLSMCPMLHPKPITAPMPSNSPPINCCRSLVGPGALSLNSLAMIAAMAAPITIPITRKVPQESLFASPIISEFRNPIQPPVILNG